MDYLGATILYFLHSYIKIRKHMKKGIRFMIFGTVLLGSMLSGCSTDNSIECPEDFTGSLVDEENNLLGTWQLSAIVAGEEVDLTDDNEENPDTDIFVQYTACEKDTEYTFGSDRAYVYSQATNESNCSNMVTITGTWKLANGSLGLVGNCSVQNLNVVFNDDKSAFSVTSNYTITDVNGVSVQTDVTFTYSKLEPTP